MRRSASGHAVSVEDLIAKDIKALMAHLEKLDQLSKTGRHVSITLTK